MTHPWEGAAAPPATAAGAPCASCSPSTSASNASSGTNGAFVAASISTFGASASVTLDSQGNVYVSSGRGFATPGASIAVGAFHSKGTPEDYFVGESTCVNGGTEGVRLGGEVCRNESGNSAAVTWGVGLSPYAAQTTTTTKVNNVNLTGLRESPARRGAPSAEPPPVPTTRAHGH